MRIEVQGIPIDIHVRGHDKCALVMSSLHRERTWIARGWVSVARPLVLRAYHYSVR